MAIKHPMLNRRFGGNRTVHGVVIGVACLVSAGYSLPWLVAYDIVTTSPDDAFCINILPLDTRVYAMINFFVLYIAPLVFMTFVYVRMSIILWHTDTILSLPLTSLPLVQPNTHLQQQNLDNDVHYLQQSAARSISSGRISSCQTSPCLSSRSPLQTSLSRFHLHGLNSPASVRHLSVNEVLLPLTNNTSRRSTGSHTASNTRTNSEGRLGLLQPDNHLTSRRKVVRLLAAIVISFALCMLPHHVRVQRQQWTRSASYSYEEMYIPPVTTLVFYINSCLNPVLYALISDKFRQAFVDLGCCWHRHAGSVPPPSHPPASVPAPRHVVGRNSQPH